MKDTFSQAIKSGHGNAIIYAGALGLLLSDIIPTPADAVYFHLQRKNKEKLESKLISPKQYWTYETLYYYGLNPLWWSLVLGSMYFTKGHFSNKLKIGIGIMSAGAVLSILHKNIIAEKTPA